MPWHAVKKARSEDNTGGVKSKAQENGADAKQSIKKDEPKGKSKNKKGDDNKVKNIQSQTEVPKGQLHSNVLVLLLFPFFKICTSQNSIFEISFLVAHLL